MLIFFPSNSDIQICPPGWTYYVKTAACYLPETQAFKKWDQAREACAEEGGATLIDAEDDDERIFVMSMFTPGWGIWVDVTDIETQGA